ncbi:FAD-linked oxidases family protein isoform 1 [Dorcoceras hygrometricum]|uniref:D-lactate dehydrogenase (cytochrome) n=1 Tax=Dorcoceras hygrometricum TaxID=472368 RepID=A0A2Z7CRI9_9LAMI|nr:FAD-linked oxidases family protein isoform 1 [Dorcoceras hygrometricum]
MNSTDVSGDLNGSDNIGGFGYGIGVSVGILLLITTITLASYYCTRNNTTAFTMPQRDPQAAGITSDYPRHSVVELGLDDSTLNGYPKMLYSEAKADHKDSTAACCSICLADYKNTDMLRVLPECGHLFHLKCVDPWLRRHPTCPVCRTSPIPTPLSTPLAENRSRLLRLGRGRGRGRGSRLIHLALAQPPVGTIFSSPQHDMATTLARHLLSPSSYMLFWSFKSNSLNLIGFSKCSVDLTPLITARHRRCAMAFPSWFCRLRHSKPIFTKLRQSIIYTTLFKSHTEDVLSSESIRKTSWITSLLPVALAVSAGSIALQSHYGDRASFCDAPNLDQRGKSFGGKDSTEYLVKGSHRKAPRELVEELKAICEDNMTLDYDERYYHGKPQNSFHKAVNIPDIVVFPRSEEEVSKILKSCNKHKVPIVPYGGATSIEGHTLSPNGGVCIDMSLMKRVKSLNVKDMDVVVEPGIGWMELNEYLESYGLFFPLDPGPGATIGGMCATRCSGSLAVRYGTMRDNVINLKVVLANGDIVKTGSRARKSAAGYDLTRLMIGSEGTLGVITEVTLRLQKIPQHSVVAMCNFPTVKDAADVAIATMLSGIQVSRVELLDEVQVRAINVANGKALPEAPTLLFEFIGTEAYSREQTLIVQKIASEHNGSDFVFAEDPEAKKELWKDVCVPLSHLAELISTSKKELDSSSLVCTVIAHAGDGNFHTVVLFDPDKEEQQREAERLNHFMVHTALAMEGTCTGEHGVGTGKMKCQFLCQYLEKELGMEALQTMKKIKVALDPNNIMNPGKLIPPHVCF